MDIPTEETEKLKHLYAQINADDFKPEQTTYGVEWNVPALDEKVWNNNGLEYQTLQMATYVRNAMTNEHMKTRIIKYNKTIKKEVLDV